MPMKCTHCGAALTAGAWSCPGCGLKFTQPVPADSDAAGPQVPPIQTPPVQNPPPYVNEPPIQTPPQYDQAGPPVYGQAAPPAQKKSKLPMALGIGCLVLLVIGIVVIRGIYVVAKHAIAEGTKAVTSSPTPPSPVVTTAPPVGAPDAAPPSAGTPDAAPSSAAAPTSGSDSDNALALSANMTKFGECLQQFGAINSHPRLDDADWKQQMEQNTQEMKTIIGEERQLTWPSSLTPAKANYEAGLAEYEYLADHWPAAVENGDMNALKDCQDHAERAKTLVLQAEAQIKQLAGS